MAKILFSIYILLSLRPLLFPHIYTQVYTKLINTNSNNTKKKKKKKKITLFFPVQFTQNNAYYNPKKNE